MPGCGCDARVRAWASGGLFSAGGFSCLLWCPFLVLRPSRDVVVLCVRVLLGPGATRWLVGCRLSRDGGCRLECLFCDAGPTQGSCVSRAKDTAACHRPTHSDWQTQTPNTALTRSSHRFHPSTTAPAPAPLPRVPADRVLSLAHTHLRPQVMRLMLVLMCEPLFQKNVGFDPTVSRCVALTCSGAQ